ncbi:hypothetical protein TherJR_1317 [Thermincola potens JR]|uniref:Uncharacterized protein n=2 Tax=Thermincola TaxID=278993 RepID=D5XEV6_THEPJ|nr:hypothetical protein TherJR_1317 [Thermincola potens JR]
MKNIGEQENNEIPCNYSFFFYEHPVYSSNMIYGIERDIPEEPEEEKTAADEPIESWGWVNNVDKDF